MFRVVSRLRWTHRCEGGELFDKLVDKGPFKERQAATLCRKLASALRYMHKYVPTRPHSACRCGNANWIVWVVPGGTWCTGI